MSRAAASELKTFAGKTAPENLARLKWLAYIRNTTVSAIVSSYVNEAIEQEDFTGYKPLELGEPESMRIRKK